MKKTLLSLVMLLMTAVTAKAENVEFNTRYWDDTEKSVYTKPETADCSVIEGKNWEWQGLGEKGQEKWYVVNGDAQRKVLNIFGTVHLVLADGAKMSCGHIKLESNNNAILHVHSQSDGDSQGKLVVNNDDVYEYAAAIGGGDEKYMGSLIVHGGDISATAYQGGLSYSYAAGIGGGDKSEIAIEHRVVIYAGKVYAKGGTEGAGIGGGRMGNQGGSVIIYGGEVKAIGGTFGAGIGGGNGDSKKGNGGVVKIYGGKVIAGRTHAGIGGGGCGIGGGFNGRAGEVHIYGGDVEAYGATYAAGIGGSDNYGGGSCEITGGTVFAKGGATVAGNPVAAIGGGSSSVGSNVSITGGTVKVVRVNGSGALIGGGKGNGTLKIGNGMKVSWSTNGNAYTTTPTNLTLEAEAKNRENACTRDANTYAVIEPCQHNSTGSYYKYLDELKHGVICKACGKDAIEYHNYVDGKCLCGAIYSAPPETYTITIHLSSDGKNYIAQEHKIIKGNEYMLPIPMVHNGLTFMGYLQENTVDGVEMKASEIGHLRDGGETITNVNNDIHYYGRYLIDYTEEWTWEDECTKASVKITNPLNNETQTLQAAVTEVTEERVEPTETKKGQRYYLALATYNKADDLVYNFATQEIYYIDPTQRPTVELDATNSGANHNLNLLKPYDEEKADVTLNNRTLYRDGKWNTIVLPYDLTIEGSVLAGATARELKEASITDKTLNLIFSEESATVLEAGVPYIIRWESNASNISNPAFNNVQVNTTLQSYDNDMEGTQKVRFIGSYDRIQFTNDTNAGVYMLGADNKLHPVNSGANLAACCAYFKLGTDEEPLQLNPNNIIIDFGEGDETGIENISPTLSKDEGTWYSIDGKKQNGEPTKAGVYVSNGKKIIK